MKKSTSFNIALLKYAIDENILKPIALYYLVRAKFHNPIIYNYTPNRLAKLTGLHHKTIVRYVKKLMDRNLVEMRGKHLVFKKSPFKGYTKTLNTVPYNSFEGLLNRIQFLLLFNNRIEQQYKIAERHGIRIYNLNPKAKKKAVRHCKLEPLGLESNIQPIVTANSASRLYNVSRTTANNILNKLKKRNYITLKNKIACLGRKPKDCKYLDRRFFTSNGFLFKHCGREFNVSSFIAVQGVSY